MTTWTRSWQMAIGLGVGGALLFGVGLLTGHLVARDQKTPTAMPIPELLGQAHVLLDRGDLQGATLLYRQVLARDSSSAEALTHLGNVAYAEGDVDRAIDLYNRALAVDPDYAHALYDKGVALRHGRKDYAGAIAAWRRFLEVMPAGEDTARVQGWISEAERLAARGTGAARPAARPLAATLSPDQFAGKTARAYQIARELPAVLDRLPCYCGCHRTVGHANLLACFVDSHAATCDICQESAQVAV